VVRRVRQDARHWRMPLVMLTGIERAELVRRCFVAGADDFLAKPVETASVLQKVQAVQRAGEAPTAPAAPRGKAVLVASDDDGFTLQLGRLLEASGYDALRARSAAQAEQVLDMHRLEVGVVDLALAGAPSVARRMAALPGGPALLAVAPEGPALAAEPTWRPLAVYHRELELERLVRHLGALRTGSAERAERRSRARVAFASVVHFRFYGTQTWQLGFGYDLSQTGLFIRTLTPLAAKRPVEVRFRLADGARLLEARGLTVWTSAYGPRDLFHFPYGMGVAFADFPLADWARVHEFVQQRTDGRVPPGHGS
jgi:CheY-like chemotaxis protein